MQTLKYVIGADRRALVKDVQDFKIDFSGVKNWLQARQYEDGMRQVFVDVANEDGTPFDLTGCNVMFEGLLPDGTHRIMDAKHSVMIDPTNGQFRFDFPKQAFPLAGSYKQAFFRIMRDGSSVTTLEFNLEVLADKVISGIVPSDYLTPFEDLYAKLSDILANADGEVKTKIQEWQTQINQLITNLNGDYASIQLLVTGLQSQLDDIAQKIKDGNVVTAKDLTDFENSITEKLADVDYDESIDTGGVVPTSLMSQLDDFKAKLPSDQFKIAIISDSHYENRADETINGSYPYTSDAYQHLAAFAKLQDSVDVMIANGDNVNGLNISLDNTKQELSKYAEKVLTGISQTDRYVMLGNHDDGSPIGLRKGVSKILPSDVLTNGDIEELFHTKDCINGEIRNDGSLYFYKDYDDKKIRLIGLYTEDIPVDAVNSDGTSKYNRWLWHTYGQAQIDWLAKVALKNIPADYQIVVVSHAPLYYGWTDNGAHQLNYEIVKGLLDAVVVGNAYSGSSASDVPADLAVSVSADYTSQGSRTVAAFIAGHVHKELTVPLDHFTMSTVTCDANINKSIASNSSQSMAFTVYAFDTAKRTVSAYGFGRSTDRTFTY